MLIISLCLVYAAIAISGACAQFAKPEYVIKYRKAIMFLIAQHFERLRAMVNEKIPYNQEVFTKNAILIETLSRLSWEAVILSNFITKCGIRICSSIFLTYNI